MPVNPDTSDGIRILMLHDWESRADLVRLRVSSLGASGGAGLARPVSAASPYGVMSTSARFELAIRMFVAVARTKLAHGVAADPP